MQRILFLFFFICLQTILYSQGSLKVQNSTGEGINFNNRTKTANTTIYAWGHFSANLSNSFQNKVELPNNQYNFTLNRARLGARGFILEENLRYHFQYSFAPNETQVPVGSSKVFFNGLLDAFFEYEFFDGFVVSVGQRFLPGARNAFTGARNLQFLDRSELFSFSGYDRDVGAFGWYSIPIGKMKLRPTIAVTQGDGRNISPNLGGLNYQARIDFFPLGDFVSDNEFLEGDGYREFSPKLVLGGGIGYNDNARREGGLTGKLVEVERDIISVYADLLFKYNGFSFMTEFFEKFSDIPVVYNTDFEKIAVFSNGYGYNFQTSYMLQSNWELAARYSTVFPTEVTLSPKVEKYSIAINRYIAGHGVKFQSEISYTNLDLTTIQNRLQLSFLFAAGF